MFRFVRAYPPARPAEGPVLLLQFHNGEFVHRREAFSPVVPGPEGMVPRLFVGMLDGVPCLAEALPESEALPEGMRTVGLRSLYGHIDEAYYVLVGYAAQLVRWQRTARFCSVCASEMRDVTNTWGRECPNCGHTGYPPVSPAVLALVHDGGDRVLLAQKPGWGDRFSILAGFVEPGESLEECVVREVHEEVGVLVDDPTYQGSQSWPFPHQIMIGFTCRYRSGEVVPDETELSRAEWFRYDAMPELPPPLSLSRQIIDRWVASRRNSGN
ncbi:MAG: NAD(+) diphosphatase [Capsulimonadales bacterium]|nr:NAD(+) diphosphatase [Capsulimonadales bacterium]